MVAQIRSRLGVIPRSVWLMVTLFCLLRLALAAVAGPGFDEAYYYVYSLHLALSYFDHPPLVGLLAGFGPLVTGAVSPLTIRLGAILLFSVTSLILYSFTRRLYDHRAARAAFLLFNITPLFMLGAGIAILPDASMSFFWLLSIIALHSALFDKSSAKNWLLFGVMAGLTMLSKYHGILLFVFLAPFMLVYKRERLLSPWPWIAGICAVVVFSPVLYWNAMHHWISFLFQGGRGVGFSFNSVAFLQGVTGQMGYLTPMVFIPMIIVMVDLFRRAVSGRDPRAAFFFCMGAGPVLLFTAIAMTRRILPHWTLAGYLTLCIPLGVLAAAWWDRSKAFRVGAAASAALIAVLLGGIVLHLQFGILPLDKSNDVTLDTHGWHDVAVYAEKNNLDPSKTFFIAHRWYTGGQIECGTGGRFQTLCFDSVDARGYALWDAKKDMRGRDGILVYPSRSSPVSPDQYSAWFTEYAGLDSMAVMRGGKQVETLYFAKYKGLKERYPLQRFDR